MKSVKEMANITDVSVRTLHYYDEIGLLKPSQLTDAGYRQYSGADIEKLQKILLLKEVGFSLADIKRVIENNNPTTEKYIFEKQKELLILKQKRLGGLINLIDSIMKGERNMYFDRFNKEEITNTFDAMLEKLNEIDAEEYILKNGGTKEKAQESFEEAFMSYDGDLKYYLGNKEMSEVVKEAPDLEEIEESRGILVGLYQELGKKKRAVIDDEVLSLVREIRNVTVAMFPVEKKDELFRNMAKLYATNQEAIQVFDSLYGEGSAVYYNKCVVEFYKRA